MNKLMMFPLITMIIISFFVVAYTGPIESIGDTTLGGSGFISYNLFGDGKNYYHDNNTGENYLIQYDIVGNGWGFVYGNKIWHSNTNGDMPDSGELTDPPKNIFTSDVIYGILLAALILGGLAGIFVIGTGLSQFSQRLVFTTAIWGAVWIALSIVTIGYLASPSFGPFQYILYPFLTIIYVIGFASDVQGAG
jgi:hypothetical protein